MGIQLHEFLIVLGEMEDQKLVDGALFRLASQLLLLGQALPAACDGPHDLLARLFRIFRECDMALRLGGGHLAPVRPVMNRW